MDRVLLIVGSDFPSSWASQTAVFLEAGGAGRRLSAGARVSLCEAVIWLNATCLQCVVHSELAIDDLPGTPIVRVQVCRELANSDGRGQRQIHAISATGCSQCK